MESFVVLGHAPGLSLAEVFAVLPGSKFTAVGTEAAVLDGDLMPAFSRLGGAVKVGQVSPGSWTSLETALAAVDVSVLAGVPGTGKLAFGFSAYSAGGTVLGSTGTTLKERGLLLKRTLKAERSVRFVNKGDRDLSSVSVAHNGLTQDGVELVFLATPSGWRRGRTAAVQNFEAFGDLDYGRPARDMELGMLPPKLARIMLNLAGAPATVLDPFCGVGTVLQEALILGGEAFGSDVAAAAVDKARQNLEWLEQRRPDVRGRWHLAVGDARNLPSVWKDRKFAAVVTEPYLGPQLTSDLGSTQVLEVQRAVASVLLRTITSVAAVLQPQGVFVLALPIWRVRKTLHPLEILPHFERVGFTKERLLPDGANLPAPFGPSKRGSLTYERPQQHVLREIFRFRRA